jgi:hypothetical protein
MGKKTFKVIVILVSLLFLNIEAAQAGLVTKFRHFIQAEFPQNELWYIIGAVFSTGFVLYVICAPVPGQQKTSISHFDFFFRANSYTDKRMTVKKIAATLHRSAYQQKSVDSSEIKSAA